MRIHLLHRLHGVSLGGGGRKAPPTRSTPARRVGATGVVAAVVAVTVWMAQARPTPPAPGRIPPFTLGRLEAEHGDGRPTVLALAGPGALLYVDDTCRFCAEEMRRWHAATGDDVPAWLTVIRHPAPGVAHPGVVPAAWADRALVDRKGAIGAQLGVTAVPFLAVTDSLGTVVHVTLGLTPPEGILTLIETLANRPGKGDPQ